MMPRIVLTHSIGKMKKLLEPIKPGEILREDFMDQFGFSINKLSRDLSVGIDAQFCLNLQTDYDLRMMKRKIWPDIERRIIPVNTSETVSENSPMA